MLSSVKSWWSSGYNKDSSTEVAPNEGGEPSPNDQSEQGNNEVTNAEDSTSLSGSQSTGQLNVEFRKAFESAKYLSNHVLSLGKSASEMAAKNVSATAKLLAEQVQENDLLSKAPVWSDFNREQERFIAEQKQKSGVTICSDESGLACMAAGHLPWEDCENNEEMASLRQQVLDLSLDERHFMRNPPPGANFDFQMNAAFQKCCLALLTEDPKLKEMRFRLVPRKVKEDVFWRNYFYRISLIKQSHHLRSLTSNRQEATSAGSRSPEQAQRSESSIESYDRLSDFDETRGASEAAAHATSLPPTICENSPQATSAGHTVTPSPPVKSDTPTITRTSGAANDDEWEEEIQKELQAFEMLQESDEKVTVGEDDDLEREIMEQLALEK